MILKIDVPSYICNGVKIKKTTIYASVLGVESDNFLQPVFSLAEFYFYFHDAPDPIKRTLSVNSDGGGTLEIKWGKPLPQIGSTDYINIYVNVSEVKTFPKLKQLIAKKDWSKLHSGETPIP
jgi:hypothetical protein